MKRRQNDEGGEQSEQGKKKNGEGWKIIEHSVLGPQNDLLRWPWQRVDAQLLRSQGAQSDRAARL